MDPINEKVFLESLARGDDKGYDYLADNTDNNVILGTLGNLSTLYELSKSSDNICSYFSPF